MVPGQGEEGGHHARQRGRELQAGAGGLGRRRQGPAGAVAGRGGSGSYLRVGGRLGMGQRPRAGDSEGGWHRGPGAPCSPLSLPAEATGQTLLYALLPLALLPLLAALLCALLVLWTRRKGRALPPQELLANNAPHLIHNATRGDHGQPLDKGGLPLPLPHGLPKMDISNLERAKLNGLNVPAGLEPKL